MKLIFSSFLFLSFNLQAEDLSLHAGAEFDYYHYEEPGVVDHSGLLIGAWIRWAYILPYYQGEVQGDLKTGQLDYSGSICNITTSICTAYKAKTNVVILKLAHRFQYSMDDDLSVFAGVGYRYLYDKGEGSGFYRRIGQYFYLPLGLTTKYLIQSGPNYLVFDFEYDQFISGQIESKLSDTNQSYSDVKHSQNQGRAFKLIFGYETVASFEIPKPWHYQLIYEKWLLEQTDDALLLINGGNSGKSLIEPKNYSEMIGLQIGWDY